MAPYIGDLLELAGKATVIGLLALFIFGVITGSIRLPREIKKLEADLGKAELQRDEWRDLAMGFKKITVHTLQVLEKTPPADGEPPPTEPEA